MNRRYYMVRAMAQDDADFDVFFLNSVVATGWSAVPFADYGSPNETAEAVRIRYYSASQSAPQAVGRKLNEVRRFKQIASGDVIVVPWRSQVALAVATGELVYDSIAGRQRDLANQHRVSYLLDGATVRGVPRATLSHRLQRRLRVLGSAVTDLGEFADELEYLLQGETAESVHARAVASEREQIVASLRQRLASGSQTTLRAGGLGLEELVRQLLMAEGYDAKRLGTRTFQDHADADILAVREEPARPIKLLVQVKHHEGLSESWGAAQLEAIKENSDLFADHDLALVTTAVASADLRKACSEAGIYLVEGDALANWVYERADRLSNEMQRALGLSVGIRLH